MMFPMIKILVLDDDPVRHRAFDVVLRDCQVDHAWTARAAIESLMRMRYDIACLDYDLDQFGVLNPGDGLVVARWIARETPADRWPGCVVVHSQNITGAARMLDVLLEAGVPVLDRPFSLGMLQDLAHDIRSRVPGISRSRSKRAR